MQIASWSEAKMRGLCAEADLRAEARATGAERSKAVVALERGGAKRQKERKPTHLAVRPGRSEPVLRRWEPAAAL